MTREIEIREHQLVLVYFECRIAFRLNINNPEQFKHSGKPILSVSRHDQGGRCLTAAVKENFILRQEVSLAARAQGLKHIGNGRIRENVQLFSTVRCGKDFAEAPCTRPENFTCLVATQPVYGTLSGDEVPAVAVELQHSCLNGKVHDAVMILHHVEAHVVKALF